MTRERASRSMPASPMRRPVRSKRRERRNALGLGTGSAEGDGTGSTAGEGRARPDVDSMAVTYRKRGAAEKRHSLGGSPRRGGGRPQGRWGESGGPSSRRSERAEEAPGVLGHAGAQ